MIGVYTKKEKAWNKYDLKQFLLTAGIYIVYGKSLVALAQNLDGNIGAIPIIGVLLAPYLPLEPIAANLIVFGLLGLAVSVAVNLVDNKKV